MRRAAALLAVLCFAGCGDSAAPPPPGPPSPTGAKTQNTKTSPGAQESTPQPASFEDLAQALLDQAAKTKDLAAHHEVGVRHPFTKAGRKAIARCVELEADQYKAVDQEFTGPRATAEKLQKESRFGDAVSSLKSYAASTPEEGLKRRAESLIQRIENEARRAYVAAIREARKLASSGSHDEAAKRIKAASEYSTSEVRDAAERDLGLLDRHRQTEETKRSAATEIAAQQLFGDRATHLMKRAKERAYAEVLKELDAAIADPALAGCRERLAADRAAVAAASAFWDAVQKTLKARVNQEVILKPAAEGKPLKGVLKRIHETGASVRLEPGGDVALDSLHPDQILLLGVNRDGLAEDAGASYAAAAMWFFLEGRHDVSRMELATAGEMGVDLTRFEAAWRRGFFRSAQVK